MSVEKELDQAALRALVEDLREQVVALREENAQLTHRLAARQGHRNPTERLDEPYSLRAEEYRERDRTAADSGQQKKRQRQHSPRRGRVPTQEKIDTADRIERVIPEGCDLAQCQPLRERPVWRIENGQAGRIVYALYRGPGGEVPCPDGVLPRSEFGVEIHIAVAFLTFILGLSLDKVCSLMKFFWQLDLAKSQADALLTQLARVWEAEFEALCQLLAVSAVVHADETSGRIKSVWAFLSDKVRLLVFGCNKDGETLEAVLPKDSFEGILISDEAAVYRGFSQAQKCWAHLLRKAIRLTRLAPDNARYRAFLDGLLTVYRTGKRCAADQRLGDSGRVRHIDELTDMRCDLCGARFLDAANPETEAEKAFCNLVHELVRLLGADELFTFVRHPQAPRTTRRNAHFGALPWIAARAARARRPPEPGAARFW